MRKLLNTLYVTSPKSYLSLVGENIVVMLEDNEKFRLPFVNIENIVCFGYMGASPALMGKCADGNIGLSFLKPNGEFLARITGKTKGSVFLRKAQYLRHDEGTFCLDFSKTIVSAKLHNSRFAIDRAVRDNKETIDTSNMAKVSAGLKEAMGKVWEFPDKDTLRGFEGGNAKQYFGVFDDMILQQKKDFYFHERNKRPPLDNVNCMLSYIYTILSLEVSSALETVGLDPYVGFFHELRSGRASLAVDLVEELRAYMADRFVLSLVNLKKVAAKDFIKKEGGGVLMSDAGRKKILSAWQERKKDIITHSVIGEKIEVGLLPYVQSQLLARYLRGDLDNYPAFICK